MGFLYTINTNIPNKNKDALKQLKIGLIKYL